MAQHKEHVGKNRTGVQMSPVDTHAMLKEDGEARGVQGDETAMTGMRRAYINESANIGSVPLPGSMTGALKMGAHMLKGDRPQVLLDKLGERLAFERTGTRLYEALLTKCASMLDGSTAMSLEDVAAIRAEEARHFQLVKKAIESLGGDPTCMTPSADVAGVEAMGLMQVVTDPRTTLSQSLHAILTAELSDQAGWETLIALADENGQTEMVNDFSDALATERRHLGLVQSWYEEALGLPVESASLRGHQSASATATGRNR